VPYPGPAILWPPTNTLIHPDPETGWLPGALCPRCGRDAMAAIVLHQRGARLVALTCTDVDCTAAASPAVPF